MPATWVARLDDDAMTRRSWMALAIVVACLLPVTAGATVFYVRAAGSDDNDGRSPATAFATIFCGARAVANPGDRVVVGPGTYREGNLGPSRGGIPGRPVTFSADVDGSVTGDPAGAVIVQPPLSTGGSSGAGAAPRTCAGTVVDQPAPANLQTVGFLLLGLTDVVIEGFTVEGFRDAGIQVRSAPVSGEPSSAVTIRDCQLTGNLKRGLDVQAIGPVTVEGNRLSGNGSVGINIGGCVTSESCGEAETDSVTPRLSNNTVDRNGSHGIFVEGAAGGVVQNNTVVSNLQTGVRVERARDLLVVNNLLYDNRQHGIALSPGGTGSGMTRRVAVVNNTIYANAGWGLVLGSESAPAPQTLALNNVFQLNGLGGTSMTSESTCGYVSGFNLTLDGYGYKTPASGYDVFATPRFVDPAGPDGVLGGDGFADDDFHLRQPSSGDAHRSAAVDAGSAPATEIGLTGSTATSGVPDTGTVDIGFHYGAAADQIVDVRAPFMPLYVRVGGDDREDGRSPARAMATVRGAAGRAAAGVSVVVGPGRYGEGDIAPQGLAGRVSLIADPTGAATGDEPGIVLVDASGRDGERPCAVAPGGRCDNGFLLLNSCYALVDGFHVTGAGSAGIQAARGSLGSVVRNNVSFSNGKYGIDVSDSDDVVVTNNLAYANGGDGVKVDGNFGSKRAVVENNTFYGNGFNGVVVGTSAGASPCARVMYNVVAGNGENGFQLDSNLPVKPSLKGYEAGYNVCADRYADERQIKPKTDLALDPLLVNPAGDDGDLGGDGFADDSFALSQTAAGQGETSPAVDFAPVLAAVAGLAVRTTRTDGVADQGPLDVGYHYPGASGPDFTAPEGVWQTDRQGFCYHGFLAGDCNGNGIPGDCNRPSDCNGDGYLSVDELVRAVRICLGELPLIGCARADRSGDGILTVDELVALVMVAVR